MHPDQWPIMAVAGIPGIKFYDAKNEELGVSEDFKAYTFTWMLKKCDERVFTAGGSCGRFWIWKFESSNTKVRRLCPNSRSSSRSDIETMRSENRLLLVGTDDGEIEYYRIPESLETTKTISPIHSIDANCTRLSDFCFLPGEAETFVSSSWSESGFVEQLYLCIWNVEKPKTPVTVLTHHEHGVNSLRFDKEHYILFSGSFDKTIGLYDIRNSSLICQIQHPNLEEGRGFYGIEYVPEHQMIIAGENGGGLYAFDLRKLKMNSSSKTFCWTSKIHASWIRQIRYASICGKKMLYSAGADGSFKICQFDETKLKKVVKNVICRLKPFFDLEGLDRNISKSKEMKMQMKDLENRITFLKVENDNDIFVLGERVRLISISVGRKKWTFFKTWFLLW